MEAKITVTELNNGECFIKYQQGNPHWTAALYIDIAARLTNHQVTVPNAETALKLIEQFKNMKQGCKVKRIVLEETIDV